MSASILLDVANLSVDFTDIRGDVAVLDNVSFAIGRQTVGIVGESGSGKSTLARAVLGILPRHATVRCRHMVFDGQDINSLPAKARSSLLGSRMTMILQDPRYALNPVVKIGDQVTESLVRVKQLSRREARERALAALAAVKLKDPAALYHRYPHEVSGGMGQRVMIAMMTVLGPDLLFADEPTSALDEHSKRAVLETLRNLAFERAMGLVLISHDLDLVSEYCDRIIVMKDGRIEEDCQTSDVTRSQNAYTQKLLSARLSTDAGRELYL